MRSNKSKTLTKKNKRLLAKLQKSWVWHGGNIERAIEFSKITVRDRLDSIEILFNPKTKDRKSRQDSFNVKINHLQLKSFRKSGMFLHSGNKELKRAIKEIDMIHQRQYFRNYEILKLLLKEAQVYQKALKKNSLIKKLSSNKTEIGKDFKHYRKTRILAINDLVQELKMALKSINKYVLIDNLKGYIDAFEDFFIYEEITFKRIIDRSIEKIYEKNKEIVIEKIQKENETNFDLPSWNLFIEASE